MKLLVSLSTDSRFVEKRRKNFQKKLQGVIDDLPGAFQLQSDLEKELEARLTSARKQVNSFLIGLRLEAAPLYSEYKKDTLLPEVVVWELDGDKKELAREFWNKHHSKLYQAVKNWVVELNKIAHDFNGRNWPIGQRWASHTRLPYEKHEATRLLEDLDNV